MPRSPESQVNWCVASGECEKKSQTLSGSGRLVDGSYFCEWMESGNLMPSRMKKAGGARQPAATRALRNTFLDIGWSLFYP
jgi:hypothetical protein